MPRTTSHKSTHDAETDAAEDATATEAVAAVDEPAVEETAGPSAPTYTKSRLLSPDGELITGRPVFVLAGALHDANDDDEFTADQVEARVLAWLARPVEVDNGAEEV